jgi:DNA (cytosine-5)-methyltransferase 1
MNHKEKLLEIYKRSSIIKNIKLEVVIINNIDTIGKKITSQKGVFTVLVTLLTHKILHPEQDIRNHQSGMKNGFSGRTVDTNHITPTLKELGLPSMAESGWLTRSLEQPYPYTLNYEGKISNKTVKKAFLELLDFVEKKPNQAENILCLILNHAITIKKNQQVVIQPLENPDKLTIIKIINTVNAHFNQNYKTHGGSKLPVLAFYAIYQLLIQELKRYENCTLATLESHTASDRTSKSAGDIEIFKNGQLFEAVEIKLNKKIDLNIVRIAIEKIYIFNPKRYYILSNYGITEAEKTEITALINEITEFHGCQIIINGVLPTIKYYLRLVGNLEMFIANYSTLVESDKELKIIHKKYWNELIHKHLNAS